MVQYAFSRFRGSRIYVFLMLDANVLCMVPNHALPLMFCSGRDIQWQSCWYIYPKSVTMCACDEQCADMSILLAHKYWRQIKHVILSQIRDNKLFLFSHQLNEPSRRCTNLTTHEFNNLTLWPWNTTLDELREPKLNTCVCTGCKSGC